MKLTPAQFDTIYAAIDRCRRGEDVSHVDISDLAEALGVQWATAKRMLYHASKQMGFTPTRAGTVSGQGAQPKTAAQKRKDKMLAAASALMAEYDSEHKNA